MAGTLAVFPMVDTVGKYPRIAGANREGGASSDPRAPAQPANAQILSRIEPGNYLRRKAALTLEHNSPRGTGLLRTNWRGSRRTSTAG
jgi:hypothetical protein